MGYSRGRVSHAMAGAMRVLLQDWHLMVTQLEHQMYTGHLTLQVCSSGSHPPALAMCLCLDTTLSFLGGA